MIFRGLLLASSFNTGLLWSQSAPVISSFTASQTNTNPGLATQLLWSAGNATKIAIDQSVGDVTGLSSIYVSPVQTTTYTLTASAGTTSVTQQVTVTVVDTPPPAFGSGRTFYVSPLGNDSNNGLSAGSPWQTVAKVNSSVLLPGDTVFFQRGGEWHESLIAPASGTAGNPISFADYGVGAKPKFWGSNVLANYLFVPAGNGLYAYSISTPVTAALVNHTFFLTTPTGNAVDLANSWSYSGATLIINSPDSDPRVDGNVYTAVVRQDAIFSNYMNHLVFRNLVADETAAADQGYGIRIQNSTDVLVDSCEAYRAGKHHIASINSTQFVGANLYAAWAMPGQSRVGASSIDPAVSAYVAYGDNTVSLPNQTSVWRNCVWDHPVDPQNSVNYYAFFTHGAKITSVLLDNMSSLGASLTINNTDNPSAQVQLRSGLIQNARLEAYGQSTLVDGVHISGSGGSLRMGGTNSTFQNILLEGSYLEPDGYQSAAVSLASGNTLRFSTIVLDARAPQPYSCLTLDSDYSGNPGQGAHFQNYANICITPGMALKQWDAYPVTSDFAQSQYNLYSPGAMFSQRGAGGGFNYLTFGQWQALSADSASLLGNPLFVNAALSNYSLQPGSPAIGAAPLPASLLTGNPPIPTDQAGNPRLTGIAFDIGALAYQTKGGLPGWIISAAGGTPQNATVNTQFGAHLQAKVVDSGGNPVVGITVTFSAPASIATVSFGGSSTNTALTDGNGIATSAALIANGQPGSYTVTAATQGAPMTAGFSLTNTLAATGGTLSGSGNSSASTYDLTAEGTADWVHWGDGVLNRKSGVTSQISDYIVVGSGPVMGYNNDLRAMSWVDGTPIPNGANNNGVYINFLQNGFSLTAPADTNTRVLAVHVGGWFSGGTLTASLSGGAVAPFVDSTIPANGQYDRNYTLTYSAATAGQTLTVSWVMTSGAGNVTLNGAALATAGPNISATAGTPQSAMVNTAFASPLQATVKDAGNNPMPGVAVTFMAPLTGASGSFAGSATATVMTNAGGIANAPTLTANSQVGAYTLTATAAGIGNPARFSLTNATAPPASITAAAGTSQSTIVNSSFTTALQAAVKDANNNPVIGVVVTFTAPSTGPSANFSGLLTTSVMTNASGIATAPTLNANNQAGAYAILASTAGLSAAFALSNAVAPPASIAASAGTPQSAAINTTFSTALQAIVKDVNDNAVSGVTVTFTAPSNGPSASFSGSSTASVVTNASGIATAPTPIANSQAGSYSIAAAVSGISTPATFALSNTPVQAVSAMLVQQAAGANLGNNQNTLTITLGNAPNNANLLVLFFDHVSASQTITGITGATWTQVAQNFTGNIGDSEIWLGTNPTSPIITITGTNYFGTFQPGYAIVAEFAGVSTTLEGTGLNTTGGTWPVTTASLTTTKPGDLLVTSAMSYSGGGAQASVSSPWTLLNAAGGAYSLAAAYKIVGATGSYSATWNGGGSPQVSTVILALKASGPN